MSYSLVAFLSLLSICFLAVAIADGKLLFKNGSTNKWEVFVFSTNANNWRYYDWSKITTIVEFGYHDDSLVEFAHTKGVMVSYAANFDKSILYNNTALENWALQQLDYIQARNLDGINIDFEDEINCTDIVARNNFVLLMRLLKIHLKRYKNHAQLSIDYAWSAFSNDNRCYEYLALSEPADLVFIMAYDERSQILGPCVAGANSHYLDTVKGVKSFNDLGIPLDKIVLGVPWYGYDYDCIDYHPENDLCFMREVPFRGVPCSDAAGSQIGYSHIESMLNTSLRGPNQISNDVHKIKIISKKWDDKSASPYFTYQDLDTGIYHQVWYDDYLSLGLKYSFSRSFGLAGVGFWNADSVEYTGSEVENQAGRDMWEAIPYKRGRNYFHLIRVRCVAKMIWTSILKDGSLDHLCSVCSGREANT